MKITDILLHVIVIVEDVLGLEKGSITDSGHDLRDIHGASNNNMLVIIHNVSKRFDIEFSDSELIDLGSIQAIADLILKKLMEKEVFQWMRILDGDTFVPMKIDARLHELLPEISYEATTMCLLLRGERDISSVPVPGNYVTVRVRIPKPIRKDKIYEWAQDVADQVLKLINGDTKALNYISKEIKSAGEYWVLLTVGI